MVDFVRLVIATAALFLLPGYALLAIARRPLRLDWVEALCMAVGLSLVAPPLFLYITTGLGITQGTGVVALILLGCALVVLWDWWPWRKSDGVAVPEEPLGEEQNGDAAGIWVYLLLGLVFAITLFSRLWSVRGIEYPAWTDSYGHAVISQMVIDQGRIPTTFAPYAPIDDFTYHFGFHTLAAWYYWIAAVPLLYGMVLLGQILNALVVPTTYIFVQRLFNSRIAGLVAAVVVGLLSHMPAQFVNWGRFTQLDGQIVLAVALTLYWMMLQPSKARFRLLTLTLIAFAGLFFVHYRIFIFALLFAVIAWVVALWHPAPGQKRGTLIFDTALLAVAGVVVLTPWLLRLAKGFGGSTLRSSVSGYDESVHGEYYNFVAVQLLDFGMYAYLWLLAGIGGLWGIWRRNGGVIIVLLWMLACFAGASLHYINITPLYSDTIVILALYLPGAALVGYLGWQVALGLMKGRPIYAPQPGRAIPASSAASRQFTANMVLVGVILLCGLFAIVRDTRLVEHDNIFVREADLKAMRWIDQEIPADALFYIAVNFWTPEVAHGLDGGYYLPLLAARQTIMPPQHYASDGTDDYRNLVNQRLHDLGAAPDAPSLWKSFNQYGITHIYIGARATQLDPNFFLQFPNYFTQLYSQDGVWIFGVNAPDPE